MKNILFFIALFATAGVYGQRPLETQMKQGVTYTMISDEWNAPKSTSKGIVFYSKGKAVALRDCDTCQWKIADTMAFINSMYNEMITVQESETKYMRYSLKAYGVLRKIDFDKYPELAVEIRASLNDHKAELAVNPDVYRMLLLHSNWWAASFVVYRPMLISLLSISH